MKRHFGAAVTAVAFIALSAPAYANSPQPDPEPNVDFILELGPGEDTDHWVDYALSTAGVPSRERPERIVYVYEEAINGAWLKLTPKEALDISALNGNGAIVNATRTYKMDVQWESDDVIVAGTDGRVPAWPQQLTPAGILRVDGGRDVDYSAIHVGVIDTGADRFHPDLNVVDGFDCTFEGHPDEWGHDVNGHGTHVSGTIGAKDDGHGVVGVAPNVSIHAYKVLGDGGSGSYAAVLCGIDRAMVDQVDVANMSLGGSNEQTVAGSYDPLHNGLAAAVEAGIPIVVAAGNDGADAATKSPANYPEAITVSAIADWDGLPGGKGVPQFGAMGYPQADDELALFSNDGHLVDVAAPGVAVLSTFPGGYAVASGTSMASPHVAGVIAAGVDCGLSDQDILDYSADYNSAWSGDVDGYHEPLIVLPAACK